MVTDRDGDMLRRWDLAVQRCRQQIQWYERAKFRDRIGYLALEIAAALFGLATPLLILLTDLRMLPALVGTAAVAVTSLRHIFQPKEQYLRFAHTSEVLKDQLLKFETRTSEKYAAEVEDQEALDNFVNTLSILATNEVGAWRAQMQ